MQSTTVAAPVRPEGELDRHSDQIAKRDDLKERNQEVISLLQPFQGKLRLRSEQLQKELLKIQFILDVIDGKEIPTYSTLVKMEQWVHKKAETLKTHNSTLGKKPTSEERKDDGLKMLTQDKKSQKNKNCSVMPEESVDNGPNKSNFITMTPNYSTIFERRKINGDSELLKPLMKIRESGAPCVTSCQVDALTNDAPQIAAKAMEDVTQDKNILLNPEFSTIMLRRKLSSKGDVKTIEKSLDKVIEATRKALNEVFHNHNSESLEKLISEAAIDREYVNKGKSSELFSRKDAGGEEGDDKTSEDEWIMY